MARLGLIGLEGPTAILARAELLEQRILNFGISGDNFTWYPDQMFSGISIFKFFDIFSLENFQLKM